MNNARAPNIKADPLKLNRLVDFAERLRYVLELNNQP